MSVDVIIIFIVWAALILLAGYQEAQALKRLPEWRDQRIIAWVQKDLPGPTPPVDWEAFEHGVSWYLSYGKPLDIPMLLAREIIHEC